MKIDLAIDLASHLSTTAIEDILHRPAGQTDKVMMMPGIRTEVIVELAVGVEDLTDHPLAGEFFQVAIDRRQADLAMIAPLELQLNFLGTEINLGSEHDVKDRQPLRRDLELKIFEELRKIDRHKQLFK